MEGVELALGLVRPRAKTRVENSKMGCIGPRGESLGVQKQKQDGALKIVELG